MQIVANLRGISAQILLLLPPLPGDDTDDVVIVSYGERRRDLVGAMMCINGMMMEDTRSFLCDMMEAKQNRSFE